MLRSRSLLLIRVASDFNCIKPMGLFEELSSTDLRQVVSTLNTDLWQVVSALKMTKAVSMDHLCEEFVLREMTQKARQETTKSTSEK